VYDRLVKWLRERLSNILGGKMEEGLGGCLGEMNINHSQLMSPGDGLVFEGR
jgi:hypothetical protein